MAEKKYDVIVIGAGIAGMTAAIYLTRAGKKVLVLESKMQGGQIINTVNIENWPGRLGISGAELSQEIYHQVNNLGAEVSYEEVTSIRRNRGSDGNVGNFLVKTDEAEYSCDAIIIATGTEPRKLSEKQSKEAGKRPISYCATCDGAFFKGKPVVVVGSGNTAKHEIAYLSNIASKVYHIHHDDPIPEAAVAVFVAIGRVPNSKMLEGLVELDKDGYVVAGEDCVTSKRGIFVAGDVRKKDVRQLVTAAADGASASAAALKFLAEV